VRFRDPRTINLTPLWVLIGVNVLVFIATSIASGSPWGVSLQIAKQVGVSAATIHNYPWTIVSAMFIHDGIFHIFIQYAHPIFLRYVCPGARRRSQVFSWFILSVVL